MLDKLFPLLSLARCVHHHFGYIEFLLHDDDERQNFTLETVEESLNFYLSISICILVVREKLSFVGGDNDELKLRS